MATRRKGFKTFSMKIEGRVVQPKVSKHYALPRGVYPSLRSDLSQGKAEDISLDWISSSFTWKETEQGHTFWYEVATGSGDMELAREILRSWKEQLCG